jgi:HEAT repeat protein
LRYYWNYPELQLGVSMSEKSLSDTAKDPNDMIEALITWLRHDDWNQRDGAIQGLIRIGKPAVPALIESLTDPRDDVRHDAASILQEIGWQPSHMDEMILFSYAIQEWDTLVKIGKAVLPLLREALHDGNFYVRTSVVLALGEIGGPEVLPLLESALRDPNSYVRSAAARALSIFGKEALAAVRLALQDEDKGVRLEAVHSVVAIGPVAIPMLIDTFLACDWYLRREVAQALIRLGTPVIPPVAALLKDPIIAPDAAQILRALNVDLALYNYDESSAEARKQ